MSAALAAAARALAGARARPAAPNIASSQCRRHRPPLRRLVRAASADAAATASPEPLPPPPAPPAASFPATVFNLANLIMGAGYVSVPYALACGGPGPALAALAALALLFCGTGRGLAEALTALEGEQEEGAKGRAEAANTRGDQGGGGAAQQLSPPPRELDYADFIAAAVVVVDEEAAASGRRCRVRAAVGALVLAELFGCCCCFVALGGEAVQAALALAQPASAVAPPSKAACTALAAALMLPTLLLPDLSALAALGVLGVFAALLCALLLLGVACLDGGGGLGGLLVAASQNFPSNPLAVGPDFPLVLGICAFCFAGHGAFPAVRASMGGRGGSPGRAAFPRALSAGYGAVLALCASVGLAGYACYGSSVAPVFPASLQQQAASAAASAPAAAATAALASAAAAAVLLTAVNPLSAFAITLEPVGAALEAKLGKRGGGRALPRLAVGLACAAVAVSCPFAAELAALTGSVLTMAVSLVLPGVAHALLMATTPDDRRQPLLPWRPAAAAADAAAVLVGVACAVVGGSAAAARLVDRLRQAAAVGG